MKRYRDVLTLIYESTKQYSEIQQLYDKSLLDKSLDIRIKVKNLMENLRSLLDYTAYDTYESVCKPHRQKSSKPDPRNIYFPYDEMRMILILPLQARFLILKSSQYQYSV
jgi:hypothetical protein